MNLFIVFVLGFLPVTCVVTVFAEMQDETFP